MKQSEVIKHIVVSRDMKWTTLADRVGISPNNLSMRITRGTMSVETYVKMLSALNCKLIVIPDDIKVPEGAYEVTE